MKIGVPREFFRGRRLDPEVAAAVQEACRPSPAWGQNWLRSACPTPSTRWPSITSWRWPRRPSNLARYDGVKYGFRVWTARICWRCTPRPTQGFGAEVRRRIMLGTYALSAGYYEAYYKKASRCGP